MRNPLINHNRVAQVYQNAAFAVETRLTHGIVERIHVSSIILIHAFLEGNKKIVIANEVVARDQPKVSCKGLK